MRDQSVREDVFGLVNGGASIHTHGSIMAGRMYQACKEAPSFRTTRRKYDTCKDIKSLRASRNGYL
jgi:hypothetical protein